MDVTEPAPIATLQNRDQSIRLLRAQRQLYRDAKRMHYLRLAIVFAGSVAGVAAAVRWTTFTSTIGIAVAVALLMFSSFGASREKRKVQEAAAVQETFDCTVLDLPWNELHAERPTPRVVADAATRFKGGDADLADWYPDTGTAVRPLDVLICQRSNLGWGATVHREWAATLIALTLVFGASLWVLALWQDLPALALAPLLGPLREVVDMVRAGWDSSTAKHGADKAVMNLWRRALAVPSTVTTADLRSAQDRLLTLRQSNAHVPDWFHRLRRKSLERSMRDAADALVDEADDHGHA